MAAMIGLLLASTLMTWRLGQEVHHSIDSQVKVIAGAHRLEHYGDVLLTSIRAVVSRGDTKAAAEYRKFQPLLRSTMIDLRSELAADDHADEAAKVDRADQALVAMEYEALGLVSRNQTARAKQIIDSPRYAYHLNVYEKGLRRIEDRAKQYLQALRDDLVFYLWLIVGLSAASLLLIVIGWFSLIGPARRWSKRLDEARLQAEVSTHELRKKQAELEGMNRKLFEQARTDPLTGLLTRLKFNEDMAELWPRVGRPNEARCALMCDIDFFKQYNDTYGHLAGDRVLASVSAALRSVLRDGDRLYRFGGDEFLAILPCCEPGDARDRAEEFRAAVEKLQIFHIASSFGRVTLSVGAACLNVRHIKSPQAWLNEADKALYSVKEDGRNAVAVAGELVV